MWVGASASSSDDDDMIFARPLFLFISTWHLQSPCGLSGGAPSSIASVLRTLEDEVGAAATKHSLGETGLPDLVMDDVVDGKRSTAGPKAGNVVGSGLGSGCG